MEPADSQTMIVSTSRFGELLVEQDKVITMTAPFLGFPKSRRFFLRKHGPDSPFMWLQSMDDPGLAFVVMQPRLIRPDYQPALPPAVAHELELDSPADVEWLLILTIPQGRPQDTTANLLGPVALNTAKRLGRQVLLDPAQYELCWPVFVEDEEDKG